MSNDRSTASAEAWRAFQDASGGIRPPQSETDYERLRVFLNNLTDLYNCNQEPYASLFDLIALYMHEWELDNEPEQKLDHLEPSERLAFLMQRRGVSQYALDKAGVAHQSTLSQILAGERGISKEVAKRLAAYFGVSVEVFL